MQITHLVMNKNAYEIRLEVLSLAHEELSMQYNEKVSSIRESDQRIYDAWLCKNDGKTNEEPPESELTIEAIENLLPSTESIIKRAKELYSFVEG